MKSGGKGIGVVSAILLVLALTGPSSWSMSFIYKSDPYSFQALRVLAVAVSGGADIGECLKTTSRIREGDDQAWWREWSATAAERERAGDEFLAQGHPLSACREYFRASNYYRAAEFFLQGRSADPRMINTSRKSRECFLKAAKLSGTPILPIEIPYEKTTLPGYLCLVDASGVKRPLLIIQTGFDGTAEELYFQIVTFALARGYNCLVFEGPGQGRVIREQKLPFRHDWENVVTPVVDYALRKPEVDSSRMALWGVSFGGYLVPRAMAFEHRLRAGVVNGGVYDFHAVVMKKPELEKFLDKPEAAKMIDLEIFRRMKSDPSLRWVFSYGMFTFGAKSPTDWMRLTRPYTLKGVAGKISRPMLVCDSAEDRDMAGQSRRLYDALECPKTFMLFTKEDGAEEHCQTGAYTYSAARILNWLDEHLK